MRVVQIEPGPMPTLIASAPRIDQRPGRRRPVAILPAINLHRIGGALDAGHRVQHLLRMAVRGIDGRRGRRRHRFRSSERAWPRSPTVEARRRAGARARPWQAFGYKRRLLDVLDRHQADAAENRRRPTTSFSIRYWCSRRLASACVTPSRTVIQPVLVISSATGCCWLVAKRTSRFGQDADELARHARRAALDHGNAGNAIAGHQAEGIGERAVRTMVIGLTTMPLS